MEEVEEEQPIAKVEFNEWICKSLVNVRKARVRMVNKLTNSAKRLRDKKASIDNWAEKNKRKADRCIEELKFIKKMHPRDILKFCALYPKSLEEVYRKSFISIEEKALCHIAHTEPLKSCVSNFRRKYSKWAEDLPDIIRVLGMKFRYKRLKKYAKKGEDQKIIMAEKQLFQILSKYANFNVDPRIFENDLKTSPKSIKKNLKQSVTKLDDTTKKSSSNKENSIVKNKSKNIYPTNNNITDNNITDNNTTDNNTAENNNTDNNTIDNNRSCNFSFSKINDDVFSNTSDEKDEELDIEETYDSLFDSVDDNSSQKENFIQFDNSGTFYGDFATEGESKLALRKVAKRKSTCIASTLSTANTVTPISNENVDDAISKSPVENPPKSFVSKSKTSKTKKINLLSLLKDKNYKINLGEDGVTLSDSDEETFSISAAKKKRKGEKYLQEEMMEQEPLEKYFPRNIRKNVFENTDTDQLFERGQEMNRRGGDSQYKGRGRADFQYRGRGTFEHRGGGRGKFENRGRGRGNFEDRGRGRGNFEDRGRGSPRFRGRGCFQSERGGKPHQGEFDNSPRDFSHDEKRKTFDNSFERFQNREFGDRGSRGMRRSRGGFSGSNRTALDEKRSFGGRNQNSYSQNGPTNSPRRPPQNKNMRSGKSANYEPLGEKSASKASPSILHPSWAAKKQANHSAISDFKGKKTTFD